MLNKEVGPYLTACTKINSTWIKGLNARPKTIQLLEENIWEKLHDIGFGNDSLHVMPKVCATKAKVDKWDCIKF